MSGPSHFVFGFGFALLFYYLSDRKFSHRHMFIFGLNNWFGPDFGVAITRILEWGFGVPTDLAWNLGVEIIHSYLFWPFFSIGLSMLYQYFLRFDLKIPKRGENLWTRLPQSPLSFITCFKLVVAGGYLHFFVDDTFPSHHFYSQLIDYGVYKHATMNGSVVIMIIICFFYAFFTVWFMNAAYWSPKKQFNNLLALYFLFIAANTLLFGIYIALTGVTMAVGDEIDFGLNIWLLFMLFLPLMLVASTITPTSFQDTNCSQLTTNKLKENRTLFVLFGLIFVLTIMFLIFAPDEIPHLI